MPDKCIFVFGPESTGSMLVARICAHVLEIQSFNTWDGVGWCENSEVGHKVLHRSLPYGLNPPQYPDISQLQDENRHLEHYFILTTRDISLAGLSKRQRFKKSKGQVENEMEMARKIMAEIMTNESNVMIWSYETFMYLKSTYLNQLYKFLNVAADFMPDLIDANKKRIKQQKWAGWLAN